MTPRKGAQFDEIGYWSEIKLDIIKDYAAAYSRILSAQKNPSLHHIYIDAFAGGGVRRPLQLDAEVRRVVDAREP